RAKQAAAPKSLCERARGIDERQFDAVALRNLLGEDSGASGESQPGPEGRAGAAADGDDHIAIAAIRRHRIACEMQADFPESLGANEVCTFWQQFHTEHLHALKKRVHYATVG